MRRMERLGWRGEGGKEGRKEEESTSEGARKRGRGGVSDMWK